ncbi:MAG: alpha/beta fold hydrolase [Rhizobiaceae bacterium]
MLIRTFAAFMLLFVTAANATDRWMEIPQPAAMPEAVKSGKANVNGIEMYFAEYGTAAGTPILMIHGGLAHADVWGNITADLSKDYRVIVADTRGHGRSTNDGSEYTYETLAKDYIALLDHLGVDKVHLVGWSDGANIGYVISGTNPERLASHFAHAGNVTLAGIDPEAGNNEVFGGYIGMMAADYAKLSPTPDGFQAFLDGVVKMWGTDKPGGMEALKSVTVPTLVVQSQYDEGILMEHSKQISETIPGADLLVLKDLSHFASFQAPDEYAAAVREFVGKQ